MSSDAEAPDLPSDDALTAALRSACGDQYTEDPTQFTLKTVRSRVESNLGLPDNFFKEHPGKWKKLSSDVVREEAERLQDAGSGSEEGVEESEAEAEPEPEPVKKAAPKKRAPKKAAPKKDPDAPPKKRGRPKKNPDESPKATKKPAKKRAKKAAKEEEEDEKVDDESDAPAPSKRVRRKPAVADSDESAPEDEKPEDEKPADEKPEDEKPENSTPAATSPKATKKRPSEDADVASPAAKKAKVENDGPGTELLKQSTLVVNGNGATSDGNESDISSVLDDADPAPPKKSRSKSTSTKPPKAAKPSPKKRAPKAAKEKPALTADEELMKTLQSQLVKCGIRKVWQFELRKFDTNKAKIGHLKGMLNDIGMTGRFSEARAKQIKEERELRKDLEEIQKGEETWGLGRGGRAKRGAGAEEEEEKVEGAGSGRKLVRKSHFAFLDDQSSDSD